MRKKHYVRQEVVEATKEISDVQIPGPCPLPQSVRTAIEYVAHTAANDCKLKNGQTALFWHLIHVVTSHVNQDKS